MKGFTILVTWICFSLFLSFTTNNFAEKYVEKRLSG
jgi:hypothetical protein